MVYWGGFVQQSIQAHKVFLAQMSNPEPKNNPIRPKGVEDDHTATDGQPLPRSSPCCDFVRRAISTIPTLFGRLTCVAALREPESGCYRHNAAVGTFEPHEVDEVLRREHLEVFEAWLCLNLGQQAADLAAYLDEHLENRSEAISKWTQELPYTALIPGAALEAQRALFRSDLEMLLNIFHDSAIFHDNAP